MALIKCPECGGKVSDKSEVCIHCGYPLSKMNSINSENITYKVIILEVGANKVKIIKVIRESTGLGLKEAKELVDNAPCVVRTGLDKNEADIIAQNLVNEGAKVSVAKDSENIKNLIPSKLVASSTVRCPKCGCTNIQVVRKKFSLLTGFATNKTERVCANCMYKW